MDLWCKSKKMKGKLRNVIDIEHIDAVRASRLILESSSKDHNYLLTLHRSFPLFVFVSLSLSRLCIIQTDWLIMPLFSCQSWN